MRNKRGFVKGVSVKIGPYGARIRLVREKLGKTQAEFADIADVTARAQRNYESDLRIPNLSYLASLALADVDVGFILSGFETRHFDIGEIEAFKWLADNLGLDFVFQVNVTTAITSFRHGAIDETEMNRTLNEALERCRVGVLDSALLAGIVEAVESLAPSLDPRKKAGAIALLYRAFRPSGRVDMRAVKDAVELAK